MGIQSPPNMLGFIICGITGITALIAMALSAATCDYASWCRLANPPEPHAAAGLGVTAGVLGMVAATLAVAWFLVSELWDVGILRYLLVALFLLTSVLALVAGVVFAYALNLRNGTATFAFYFPIAVAACVWQWLLFALAAIAAFFCYRAGGGGTAALSATKQ